MKFYNPETGETQVYERTPEQLEVEKYVGLMYDDHQILVFERHFGERHWFRLIDLSGIGIQFEVDIENDNRILALETGLAKMLEARKARE